MAGCKARASAAGVCAVDLRISAPLAAGQPTVTSRFAVFTSYASLNSRARLAKVASTNMLKNRDTYDEGPFETCETGVRAGVVIQNMMFTECSFG